MEQLLLKAANGDDFAREFPVCKLYNDVNPQLLQAQLMTFRVEFQLQEHDGVNKIDFTDIKQYFKTMTSAQTILLSEVCIIFRLIMVMPATNSKSEHSYSTLRRVKTYKEHNDTTMVLHA